MNPYEVAARLRKVEKIAAVVTNAAVGLGKASEVARTMGCDERAAACRIAGVNEASDKTWALVIETLRERENSADPFAGIGPVTRRRVGA